MKTLRTKFIGFIMLFAIVSITSCIKDDFEQPPLIPHAGLTANKTIADLKATYAGFDTINQEWIIRGTVVANDESGNFYKVIEIQDSTGAIEIRLDRSYLYNDFQVGQLVFVKCNGLYLGDYGGLIQLGYIYNGGIGRIPDVLIDEHLFKEGIPTTPPTPKTITIPTLIADDICRLVKLENVSFSEVGEPFSLSTGSTNRTIKDEAGNTLTLRTSNYANFAGALIPSGKLTLLGILTIFNGTWQFIIRDLKDIQTDNTTYILKEDFATNLGVMQKYNVTGAEEWAWANFQTLNFAKISGNKLVNEDWLITPAMNFDQYTNEVLSFQTARSKGTVGDSTFKVLYSTNYSGTGDPNTATWTDINATLSAGNYVFTQSGDIDLSAVSGTNVRIAFKFKSGVTTDPLIWEVASIAIKGKHVK